MTRRARRGRGRLTVVEFFGGVVDVYVVILAVGGSLEVLALVVSTDGIREGGWFRIQTSYIATVFRSPNVTVGIKGQGNLVPQPPAKLMPLGIILIPPAGNLLHVKHSHRRAHVPCVHVEIGIAPHADHN